MGCHGNVEHAILAGCIMQLIQLYVMYSSSSCGALFFHTPGRWIFDISCMFVTWYFWVVSKNYHLHQAVGQTNSYNLLELATMLTFINTDGKLTIQV